MGDAMTLRMNIIGSRELEGRSTGALLLHNVAMAVYDSKTKRHPSPSVTDLQVIAVAQRFLAVTLRFWLSAEASPNQR